MQAQTDKLNGGPPTTTPSQPTTPHAVPVVQPAMIQELAKRLTQQMYPDKATDAQTLDGFSQAAMTLASQIGIIPQQTHPSSSTSTAEDAHMGQSQQGS
eukprot:12413039-Karenia_brevis.AAC.1